MADRFFLNQPFVDGQTELSGDQAHHVANVMRASVGDAITVFDASGNEFETRITQRSKKSVTIEQVSVTRPERKLARRITIAAALPKGDRQKFLIEKLVELGVELFIPLHTRNSVAQVNDKVIARLEKQIIEATKQCRRSYLMQVEKVMSIDEVVALAASSQGDGSHELTRFLIAHPYPISSSSAGQPPAQTIDQDIWLIGPEGGFSEEEAATAVASGWSPVSFGRIILRVETAALAAATISGIGLHV